MPKGPTANAAARSIETADKTAARTLTGILHLRPDQAGELHGRIKEEAAALLQQDDGEVTSKGNQS